MIVDNNIQYWGKEDRELTKAVDCVKMVIMVLKHTTDVCMEL